MKIYSRRQWHSGFLGRAWGWSYFNPSDPESISDRYIYSRDKVEDDNWTFTHERLSPSASELALRLILDRPGAVPNDAGSLALCLPLVLFVGEEYDQKELITYHTMKNWRRWKYTHESRGGFPSGDSESFFSGILGAPPATTSELGWLAEAGLRSVESWTGGLEDPTWKLCETSSASLAGRALSNIGCDISEIKLKKNDHWTYTHGDNDALAGR